MKYFYHCNTPIGMVTLASDGECLTALWFEGQKNYASGLSSNAQYSNLPIFMKTAEWLEFYFHGTPPEEMPPIKFIGTPFQIAVWKALLKIPYGHTTTYKAISNEVARAMLRPAMSAQAVGGAIGRNPISIIVPCHRVIGSNGKLTGYAGGLERKLYLLQHEGRTIL